MLLVGQALTDFPRRQPRQRFDVGFDPRRINHAAHAVNIWNAFMPLPARNGQATFFRGSMLFRRLRDDGGIPRGRMPFLWFALISQFVAFSTRIPIELAATARRV